MSQAIMWLESLKIYSTQGFHSILNEELHFPKQWRALKKNYENYVEKHESQVDGEAIRIMKQEEFYYEEE